MQEKLDLSIVIPLYNEVGSIEELHRRLSDVLGSLGRSYEILFVNDGSRDGSAELIDALAERDAHVGVIHFRRNYGKASALDAAFRRAAGEIVFTMDADLQDDPNEIPRFLEKLDEGYDLVSGWKQVRHDPLDKTFPSKVWNGMVRRVSGLELHDFNCGFKAYRAEVTRSVSLYGELHRFVPVLASWRGFSIGEIPVEHHARTSGVSKYGVERLLKGFFDLLTVTLLTRYSSRPLHLFGFAGLLLAAGGGLALFYLFLMSLLGIDEMRPRPLVYIGMLLIMVGVQLLSTGLLAELFNRQEETAPSHYAIREFRPPGAASETHATNATSATAPEA